jgi:Cu(I)/Ag(I) efflux system membrane fusion protein
MNPRLRNALILAACTGFVAAGVAGYEIGARRGSTPPAAAGLAAQSADNTSNKGKPLYWYDPMSPTQHFDHPGKSPFMDMQLVAKFADGDTQTQAAPGIRISPDAEQNLGIRTEAVAKGSLPAALTVTGVVDFNGRDVSIVQPRAAGFVRRVYGRAPGDVIPAGAPIVDLLAPDWVGAQTEYLAVRRAGDPTLTAAARERLHLLGMSEGLIDQVGRAGRPIDTITVRAPSSGVIQKLDVRAGMTVIAGQTLAEIDGLGSVWVTAAVPEIQAALVRNGQAVTVTLDAYPGETFAARVQSILPRVAGDSRTLQARIELPNRRGRLRPGMFANVSFGASSNDALSAPTEALIRTGRRTLVMLARPDGRYESVEVTVGREGGGRSEILAGLNAGDRVVASGQFLIDSEANLSDVKPRPLPTVAAKTDAKSTPADVMSGPPMPGMAMSGMTMSKGVKP